MSIIAINILTPSNNILAAYMQHPDYPDVWTWFDEHGNSSFTVEQHITLRAIAATGTAKSMCEDGGIHGKLFRWFDGRTFRDIRVSAILM